MDLGDLTQLALVATTALVRQAGQEKPLARNAVPERALTPR